MPSYLRPIRDTSGGLSRRSVLVGAGLAAAALGGLTACAQDGAGEGQAGPVEARTGDIPVGGGKIFGDAQTVVTQPSAGTYKAFSSICTHARCPVSTVTDSINCNCHGSRFSLNDGSVLAGPAQEPLPARTVQVQGDRLSVPA
jgi:Rieske Fe-S protein